MFKHSLYGIIKLSLCHFQSERIKDAIYGSNWYGTSQRFKKAIGFIIMRTHRPIEFSVGGFSIASRETWLSVSKLC